MEHAAKVDPYAPSEDIDALLDDEDDEYAQAAKKKREKKKNKKKETNDVPESEPVNDDEGPTVKTAAQKKKEKKEREKQKKLEQKKAVSYTCYVIFNCQLYKINYSNKYFILIFTIVIRNLQKKLLKREVILMIIPMNMSLQTKRIL